ncbi:MAG: tRNA (adenosine(37)-N6)-dimethylallyltransferase MiaA [Patescibacteria group bacterium]
MNKIFIVCGPTATGKTKLALELAKKFNGELVSADSRQVYKGLDALTGKDRSEDIPIRLYDVVDVGQEFSVAHFVRLAQIAIGDIYKRVRLPIIVGGTGFYLQALTTSIDTLTVPPNWELRKTLSSMPIEELQQRLQKVNQDRWDGMNDSDRKNSRRLIRAIEVALFTKQRSPSGRQYDALWIGLTAPQAVLKERIARRISERFGKAVTEARKGLPPILGSDPLLLYKAGKITKQEAVDKWLQAEYQYAKRQRLWFRKQKEIHWFDVQHTDYHRDVEELVREWYTKP